MRKNKIRLYLDTAMDKGFELKTNDTQSHYLYHVMKAVEGEEILGFDNQNGEFLCRITQISKKGCMLLVTEKTQDFFTPPDMQLIFAPVKKDQTDFIVQKATELGATSLLPVMTERTISEKIRIERFRLQAIEAAEQCRRVDVPQILNAISFDVLLNNRDKERHLFYMDETGNGAPIANVFSSARATGGKKAILVGPEGGFSEKELQRLRTADFATGVSLGKRILRAETAVAAALACWQALAGDWKGEEKQ